MPTVPSSVASPPLTPQTTPSALETLVSNAAIIYAQSEAKKAAALQATRAQADAAAEQAKTDAANAQLRAQASNTGLPSWLIPTMAVLGAVGVALLFFRKR